MIVNQDSGDSGLLLAVSSLPKRSRMHRKTKVESCSFISLLEILWTLYLPNLKKAFVQKPLPLHHSHQGRNFAHSNIRKEFKILSFTKTISGASTVETFQKPLEPLELCNSHRNLFKPFHRVSRFSFSKFPSEPEVMVQELELDPPHRYRPSSVAQLCQATG